MTKYIVYAILGGFFSVWSYVGSAIVGHKQGQTTLMMLAITYCVVICFLVFKEKPEKYAYVLALPPFIVGGIYYIYTTINV